VLFELVFGNDVTHRVDESVARHGHMLGRTRRLEASRCGGIHPGRSHIETLTSRDAPDSEDAQPDAAATACPAQEAGEPTGGASVAHEAFALMALAGLVALSQWIFVQAVIRIDVHLIPAHARRRVQWLVVNSTHIYLTAAGMVATVATVQAAVLLT
jgi:hypothetical protein